MKCVLVASLSGTPILISGSADATIVVWDISSGRKLHTLKGHARGILDLALDPTNTSKDEIILFSADSVREIRRWRISLSAADEFSEEPIRAHETSVNKLCFESATITLDDPDSDPDADLWTASSDNTAQRLVRSQGWKSDTVLPHPDFVRDIVVSQDDGCVVTACRDEEVRVWSAASSELACVYSGHYEEVTGLALVPPEKGQQYNRVVSVSIDGTVRIWSLDPAQIERAREEAEKLKESGHEVEEKQESKEGLLTAEEEAELAELMDDDD